MVQYIAFMGAAFIPIADPGPTWPPSSANTIIQQASTLLKAYKTNKYYHIYLAHALRALKRQWETCVEQPYIVALHSPMVGPGDITPLQIIKHLYATYVGIDEMDLETNKINIMQPYSPDQPVAILLEQLEYWRLFAAAGHQMLHDHKLIAKGETLLPNTTSFNQDTQDWKILPVA